MDDVNVNDFVWVEKYRPRKVDDVILPEKIKEIAKGYMKQGRIPNLLFTGGAGVGKTTLARAMCEEVGCDYIIINASSENSIDVMRNRVTNFASTVSLTDAKKVIILDEADHLTAAFQAAFRNALESFSANCTFILTCNLPARLMEAIHSRCGVIEFAIKKDELPVLQGTFFKRIRQMLKAENVEYDAAVLAELVKKHSPDFRRVINELQKFSAAGKIDSSILLDIEGESIDTLIAILKKKKFIDMCQWVENNIDVGYPKIFDLFKNAVWDKLQPKCLPPLVLMYDDAQTKAAVAADPSISVIAFFTNFMSENMEWK